MSEGHLRPRWRVLLTPRWLSWHLFAAAAVAGMIWLGDWQLRRALAGNTLSWAYTFEWPIFAIFGVVFWAKTIKDELRPARQGSGQTEEIALPAGTRSPGSTGSPGSTASPGSRGSAGSGGAAGQVPASAEPADQELAEYNAYLARLTSQVKGHGRWHGLR
jgi:hypothetical protein